MELASYRKLAGVLCKASDQFGQKSKAPWRKGYSCKKPEISKEARPIVKFTFNLLNSIIKVKLDSRE